jgi:hypothetical protein
MHLGFILGTVKGQIPITSCNTVFTKDFSALGFSQIAAFPCAWRVEKNAMNVRAHDGICETGHSDDRLKTPQSGSGSEQTRPTDLSLGQNQPNPVSLSRHETTTIRVTLPQSSDITLRLVDITGKELHRVSRSSLGQGEHLIELPLNGLNCGIYFYQLEVGTKRLTRKLVVVR